jgi:polysaccharide deacetylase 2 family uncharacterized protein YibQ
MFNNPKMTDEQGNQSIRRYKHQKITINHFGTKATIHENGKVTIITSSPDPLSKDNGIVLDEVTIPASLIFKIAGLLKNTREVEFVKVEEVKPSTIKEDELAKNNS